MLAFFAICFQWTLIIYIQFKRKNLHSMLPFTEFYHSFGAYWLHPQYFHPYFHQNNTEKVSQEFQHFSKQSHESAGCQPKSTMNQKAEVENHSNDQIKTGEMIVEEVQKILKSQNNNTRNSSSLMRDEKKSKQLLQIDNRNANSNLLRMFFRRLDQIFERSSSIVNRIIAKHRMKISSQKFLEWFQINKPEYGNYIRLPCIKKLFVCNRVNRSGKFQTKIMRILLQDFLRTQAFCFYLTSKKIKRTFMTHNYHSIRFVLQEIVKEYNDL